MHGHGTSTARPARYIDCSNSQQPLTCTYKCVQHTNGLKLHIFNKHYRLGYGTPYGTSDRHWREGEGDHSERKPGRRCTNRTATEGRERAEDRETEQKKVEENKKKPRPQYSPFLASTNKPQGFTSPSCHPQHSVPRECDVRGCLRVSS